MDIPKIEKLDELLKDYLGDEKTITDHETSRLTETGENYGSQMLALKIRIKNKDQSEILEAVAKIPPPGEFMQKMFNTPVTFRNEIDFYKKIVPELKLFLSDKGIGDYIDYVPEYLGSRLSLESGKNEVDAGAVILLENLKVKGYEMVDRTAGFDHETSKIIVKALAKYHAASLGLKLLKPEIFQEKIRSLFQPYRVFELDDNRSLLESVIDKNRKMVEGIDSCVPYVDRVVAAFRRTPDVPKNSPTIIREPFATVIHTDSWVNNFMVKYQSGVPVSCKIVDFQLGEYGSPVRDLLFFIFTSVQIPVVEDFFDELLKLYHQTLVDCLVQFGCDPSPFGSEQFEKEMNIVLREHTFLFSVLMLEPIFATKDSVKELDQYREEDLTEAREVPPKHKERAEFIIQQFVKRNWI